MKHQDAMGHATAIARILLKGARNVGRSTMQDQGLFGLLSIHLAASKAKEGDMDGAINSFDPSIHEIILFGSTAAGKKNPGDVDLMIFDNGFYSNVLGFEPPEKTRGGRDWYGRLRGNLAVMVRYWMGMDHPGVNQILDSVLVDLHVLPLAIFRNELLRRQLAAKHSDPRFFENAFSKIKRFDSTCGEFVEVDASYFEQKYGGTLTSTSSTH